jgi:predicted lipoprotein with Yx(FWY)xxD motif
MSGEVAAASSERGVSRRVGMLALVALLGLVGYLAGTGQLALGANATKGTVAIKHTSIGNVLVAANGHTLYLFTHDKSGKSACSGQCATFWPPLTVKTKPTAGVGAKASLLGWTKRSDGRMQVTYAHHPVYFFLKDTKAGEVEGEGIVHFGGSWWALSASGAPVKESAGGGTTTTDSTTTSNYNPPPTPGY